MTAQLSRERLEEKLLEHIKHGGDSEEETMIRMLLAGMDSKPVAWTSKRSLDVRDKIVAFTSKESADECGSKSAWNDIVPLYAAPPAPVAVPCPVCDGAMVQQNSQKDWECIKCGANAGQVTTIGTQVAVPDSFAVEKAVWDALNRAACPPAFMRIAAEACRAAMLNAGPVTGWIKCSERMPDADGSYWGWWSQSKRQGPVWFIKSDLQAQFQSSEITHWMPLPAAPEQEE